jgi:ParB-like nuclease domain
MVKHIELWLIDKLIPFARNPRTHSDAQIAQIAASIAEFGFNSPILVDSNAGIIAGHGRLLAARNVWSAAWMQAKNERDRVVCANVYGL